MRNMTCDVFTISSTTRLQETVKLNKHPVGFRKQAAHYSAHSGTVSLTSTCSRWFSTQTNHWDAALVKHDRKNVNERSQDRERECTAELLLLFTFSVSQWIFPTAQSVKTDCCICVQLLSLTTVDYYCWSSRPLGKDTSLFILRETWHRVSAVRSESNSF